MSLLLFLLLPAANAVDTAWTCALQELYLHSGACVARCPQSYYAGQYECYPCTGTPAINYVDSTFTVTGLTYLQSSAAALALGSSIAVTFGSNVYVTVKSNYGTLKTTGTTYGATFFNGATDPSRDPALTTLNTQVLSFKGTAAEVSTVLNDIRHSPITYYDPVTPAVVNAIDTVLVTISDGANAYAHIELRIRIGTAADPSKL
jgi:hypothetical protein